MKSVLLGVAAFALAGSVGGCRAIFGPDQSVVLNVEKIEVPATIASGAAFTAVFTVTTGGCLNFDRFEIRNRSASMVSVTAWGEDTSIGRDDVLCTADVRSEPHSVTFHPPFASTFTISVGRGRTAPLQATVQVQ
jgi:hypothetical protein